MLVAKSNKQSISNRHYRKSFVAVIFFVVFGLIGVLILFHSHASAPYGSVEASTGTLSGSAALGTDASASNGNYVKFGSVSSSTTWTDGGCTDDGSGTLIAAPCTNGSNSGTGDSGWGTPTFDDEFNESSLDTSKWTTGWFGSGITGGVGGTNEADCYDPAQVTVANGELDLSLIHQSETCDGVSEPYTTGFVTTDSTYNYTYGFAEARIWLPGTSSIADWPSFWQDGQDWPNDGELDILEGLGGSACGHWHGPSSGNGIGWNIGSGCSSSTYTGGWHTFGAKWSANLLTYYYDGISMGTITAAQASANNNSLVGEPQYLILGLGADGSSTVAPAVQRVDYVRVWQ